MFLATKPAVSWQIYFPVLLREITPGGRQGGNSERDDVRGVSGTIRELGVLSKVVCNIY